MNIPTKLYTLWMILGSWIPARKDTAVNQTPAHPKRRKIRWSRKNRDRKTRREERMTDTDTDMEPDRWRYTEIRYMDRESKFRKGEMDGDMRAEPYPC